MSGSLGDADRYRIRQLADFVRTRDTASLLTWLAPGLSPVERVAVAQNCTFTHAGLLVFPADAAAAVAELPALGLTPGPLVPSVVVRRRLTERYTLPADPDVWITHAAVTGCHPVRELELFLVVGGEPVVAQDEQAFNRESHFAMEGTGTPAAMSGIRELLAGAGGLQPDGGGYNPHENAASGGRTLLYFRGVELMGYPWPPRLELVMDGHHASLLARHEQTAGVTL